MYELLVEGHFAAAHKLRDYKGKCENLHGHNWKIEVMLRADVLDATGMVMDFKDVKGLLGECLGELDHHYLNEIGKFKEVNPTTENIARHVFERFAAALPERVTVVKVTAWETPGSGASYSAD